MISCTLIWISWFVISKIIHSLLISHYKNDLLKIHNIIIIIHINIMIINSIIIIVIIY